MANTTAGLLSTSWGELIADGLVELNAGTGSTLDRIRCPKPSALGQAALLLSARRPRYFPRRACSAAKSSSDSLTFLSSADHQMLHVMQPERRWPRLSISTSGCLHSRQVTASSSGPSRAVMNC